MEAFKFAAAADLHFREQDLDARRTALEHMIEVCEREEIETVIFAGDIFDTHNIHGRTASMGTIFNAFFEPIARWIERGVWEEENVPERTCFIVRGNHDLATEGQADALVGLDGRAGIVVIRETENWCLAPGIELLALPWRGAMPEAQEGAFNILAGHASVVGALQNRTSRSIGGEFSVTKEQLLGTGADLVLLGDYHRRQVLFKKEADGADGMYLGGFVQKDFGEGGVYSDGGNMGVLSDDLGNPDGFAIVTVDAERTAAEVEFQSFPDAPIFFTFATGAWEKLTEGEREGYLSEGRLRVLGPKAPDDLPDGVRYEFKADPTALAQDRRAGAEAFDLEQSPDELLDTWIDAQGSNGTQILAEIAEADQDLAHELLTGILEKSDIQINPPVGEGLRAITRIELKGIARHRHTIWKPEHNGVTALVARNGTGKTFLIEALPAAAWGEYPSRKGGLAKRLTWGGDGKGYIGVEIETSLGNRYLFERYIKKSEIVCWIKKFSETDTGGLSTVNGRGWTTVAGPKAADVAAKATEILGDKDVFLGSIFATQKGVMDLFSLKPSDRKEFFAGILGSDSLLGIGDAARVQRGATDREVLTLEDRRTRAVELAEELEKSAGPLKVERETLTRVEAERADAESADNVGREVLVRAEKAEKARTDLAELKRRQTGLDQERDQLERLHDAHAKLLAQREDLEAAVAIGKEAVQRQGELAQLGALTRGITDLTQTIKDSECQMAEREKELDDIEKKLSRKGAADQALEAGRTAWEAKQEWEALETAIRDAKRRADEVTARLEFLDSMISGNDFEQMVAQPGNDFERMEQCGACPLFQGIAEAEKERSTLNARLDAIGVEIEAIAADPIYVETDPDQVAAWNLAIQAGERASQEKAQIEVLEPVLESKRKDRAEFDERLAHALAGRTAVRKDMENLLDSLGDWTLDLADERALEGRTAAAKLEQLEGAAARAKEFGSLITEKKSAILQLNMDMARIAESINGAPDLDESRKAVEENRSRLDTLREQVPRITQRIGNLEGHVENAKASRAEAEKAVTAITGMKAHALALKLLEVAFSRDGIPQYLVDTVLPDLEAIAAEILEDLGGQFSLSFRTQGEAGTGSKRHATEDLLIIATNEKGDQADVAEFSEGERKLLAQVVRVALAVWLSRRSGQKNQVFAGDEPFDSLDDEIAQELLELFQSGRLGLAQVLLVSHSSYLLAGVPDRAILDKRAGVAAWVSDRERDGQAVEVEEVKQAELVAVGEVGA